MNLQHLFEMQAALDTHILHTHKELQNRNNLDWKVLALLVELGECANEWRGFKKWSTNQKPRTSLVVKCHACDGNGYFKIPYQKQREDCAYCNGTGLQENRNPLIEEYIDCLHFVLSIGIELGYGPNNLPQRFVIKEDGTVLDQFNNMFILVSNFLDYDDTRSYCYVFNQFLHLGEKLGFSTQEIEKAYNDKNQINHERQLSGY